MSEVAPATANLQPPSNVALDSGRVAVARHLELVAAPEADLPDFDPREVSVFSLISEGKTINQIARDLGIGREEVLGHQQSAIAKLETKSLAAAMHQAIRHGVVPVEVTPDSGITDNLLKPDQRMLKFWAAGVSEFDLARQPDLGLEEVVAYQKGLLKRVGAWSRPHAIRRGHELGIIN